MHHQYTSEEVARFWSKVDIKGENECWNWTAAKHPRGYGIFGWSKKTRRAHRLVYELVFGEIPEGLYVCHKCDNPPCCNPNHLFLGTHQDNMDDRSRKGRATGVPPVHYGEQHPRHKLSRTQVSEIRRRYANGKETYSALSEEFCVSVSQIGNVVRHKHWS